MALSDPLFVIASIQLQPCPGTTVPVTVFDFEIDTSGQETLTDAVAVVSPLCTPSTTACPLMLAHAELVIFVVALPLDWINSCELENEPLVAFIHESGKPISGAINPVLRALPRLFCKKLALSVLKPLPAMLEGEAVVLSTTQAVSFNVPPLLSAWSQPVPLAGPPLHPHQLLLALAVPPRTPNPSLFTTPAVLPTKRLVAVLPRLSVPPPKYMAPPMPATFVAWLLVNVFPFMLNVAQVVLHPKNNAPPALPATPAVFPLNVELLMARVDALSAVNKIAPAP